MELRLRWADRSKAEDILMFTFSTSSFKDSFSKYVFAAGETR